MDLVLDAHMVSWFYKVTELSQKTPCTASPADLFARLGDDHALLDEGGKIESEWRKKVDADWFEAWLAERFQLGDIVEIKIGNCSGVLHDLKEKCGFPLQGGDKWYVRTARSRVEETGEPVALISEDLDFFEPRAKSGAGNRDKILRKCQGCVVKRLAKQDVLVRTAKRHLA